MAVWSDKTDFVDTVAAAHVNQLADGFSTANTYNFGGTTSVEQLAASHAAAGAHTNKISTGDIVDNTIDPLDLETKCLATRQASAPSVTSKGRLHIDTSKNNTYCDSEGSWQAIIIGTANVHTDIAGDGLSYTDGVLAVGEGEGIFVDANDINIMFDGVTIDLDGGGTLIVKNGGIGVDQLATAIAGKGLTGGGGSPLAVQVDDATIEIATDTLQVKDGGIGVDQLSTAVAGNCLTGGGGAALTLLAKGVTRDKIEDAVLSDYGVTAFRPSASTALPTGLLYINTQTEALERFDANDNAWGTVVALGCCLYTDVASSTAVNPETTMPQYYVNVGGDPWNYPAVTTAYYRRPAAKTLTAHVRAWKTEAGDTAGVYLGVDDTIFGTVEVTGTAQANYTATFAATALTEGSIYLLSVGPYLAGTPSGECHIKYISIWEK